MEATEIFELIQKIDNNNQQSFAVQIVGIGYINMTRQEVIKRLHSEYSDKRLKEFSSDLKKWGVPQKKIAEELKIKPETFNQMLSGFIKSNKTVGDSLSFIEKSTEIAQKLCNQ